MAKLSSLEPARVFQYFEEISMIPRGSGYMDEISAYCMAVAERLGLRAYRDDANNVIIYKPGTKGKEALPAVILQGHLDMVWQKDPDSTIDFQKDGLDLFIDGDLIGAKGTTLGADNGIAVAMVLAILEDETLSHPPIEAVFTTDEEIGMVGALKLPFEKLSGRKMINLDGEDASVLTVSCAGGADVKLMAPVTRKTVSGTEVKLVVKGLRGGHSGVEIDAGRVNANLLMGRLLHAISRKEAFSLIGICGGDKGNAIPVRSEATLVAKNAEALLSQARVAIKEIDAELGHREADLEIEVVVGENGSFAVLEETLASGLLYLLLSTPNGVVDMSHEIQGLVETSLNLGILQTDAETITVLYTLRSNKQSALDFLAERLKVFATCIPCQVEVGGHYPPWEFVSDSKMQKLYCELYEQKFGKKPSVEAIHAGLECGVFAGGLPGLDCISIGPVMHDIHTTKERLSVSSTEEVYELLRSLLEACQ